MEQWGQIGHIGGGDGRRMINLRGDAFLRWRQVAGRVRGASTRRGGLRTRVDKSWVEHNDPDKVGKDQVSDLFKS